MRPSIMFSRSRGLAGLCAACAQKRIATTTTTTPRTSSLLSTSRALSTRRTPCQQLRSTPAARSSAQRRWLSASPTPSSPSSPPSAAATTEPQKTQTQQSPTAEEPKKLPSYYALFPQTLPDGPPPSGPFHIDTRALRREFLQLQAAAHPDFHHAAASTSASAAAAGDAPSHSPSRRSAEALSSHINAAYRTLSSPLLRAQYLLAEQQGIDLAGDEAASHAGADPGLLADVLCAREAIEEAESEGDLEGVGAENEGRIGECERALERLFREGDVRGAVRECVRLRYWVNIKEGVDGWEKGRGVVLQH